MKDFGEKTHQCGYLNEITYQNEACVDSIQS